MWAKLKEFWKDDSGQTLTEYVLILVVIITIFMQFRGKLRNTMVRLLGGIDDATGKALDDMNDQPD